MVQEEAQTTSPRAPLCMCFSCSHERERQGCAQIIRTQRLRGFLWDMLGHVSLLLASRPYRDTEVPSTLIPARGSGCDARCTLQATVDCSVCDCSPREEVALRGDEDEYDHEDANVDEHGHQHRQEISSRSRIKRKTNTKSKTETKTITLTPEASWPGWTRSR